MKVLVTDGANRVALAVVRALGRAGAEVAVVEQERFAQRTPASFRSRFSSRHDVIPTLADDGAFIDALVERSSGYDVLLPVSTNVVLACAAHRERFQARLPIPPLDLLRRANDKSSVLAIARKAGVPIPVTYAPENEEELDEVVSRVRLPAIVKLRDDAGTVLEPGQRYAIGRSPGALREAYRRLHALKPFPLIQEKVDGPGYGVGVLAEEGRVLAAVAHRRIREYPVTGGPSTICESVEDPRLAGYAAAVIRELRWTGVAMVEFKKNDEYRLMEVNPRFWGSLPLATRAGVNFPSLVCRRAMGEDLGDVPRAAAGVRLRFLPIDARAAWSALGDPERRWSYGLGFLRDLLDPGITDGILDPADLEASLVYLANHLP
ncbi:MAG TPA: ATP-grasp domain-containing protein [Planctomycetota bacterium]|nr:ATP-grasp domain-containing protein [Planctomycetota bacterium]